MQSKMVASSRQKDDGGSGQIAKPYDIDIPMHPIDQQNIRNNCYERKSKRH